MSMNKYWRLWAQALGEKSGQSNEEADAVARFRTILILQEMMVKIMVIILKHILV